MAIQILDSGIQILVVIGGIRHEIDKEGVNTKTYSSPAGDGVWLYPEKGDEPLVIPVKLVNNPGGLTTKEQLQDVIDAILKDMTGIAGEPTQEKLASNADTETPPIPANTSSVTVLAANVGKRKEASFTNTSTHEAVLKKGTAAVFTDQPIRLEQDELYTMTDYDGIVTAVWEGDTNGDMLVEESFFL